MSENYPVPNLGTNPFNKSEEVIQRVRARSDTLKLDNRVPPTPRSMKTGAARKKSETPTKQKLEAPVEKNREERRHSRAEIKEEEKWGLRKPWAPKKKATRKFSHTKTAPETKGTRVGWREVVEEVIGKGKKGVSNSVKNRWGGVEPESFEISRDDSSDDESTSGRNEKETNESKDIKKASPSEEKRSNTRIPQIEITSATPRLSERVELQAVSMAEEEDPEFLEDHGLSNDELVQQAKNAARQTTPVRGRDARVPVPTTGSSWLNDASCAESEARLSLAPALVVERDPPTNVCSPIVVTDFIHIGDTASYLPEAMRCNLDSRADEMLIDILQLASKPREWLDFLSVDDYEIFQGRVSAIEFGHASAYDVLVYMFGKMNDDPVKQYQPNLFEYEDIKIVLQALDDPETARTPAAIWSPYSILAELCRKVTHEGSRDGAKEYKKF
jgi:hypothetical protein